MISAIAGFFKSLALALGWMKQNQDQKTGAEIATGQLAKETLAEAQSIADARNDPAVLDRVRDKSFRD